MGIIASAIKEKLTESFNPSQLEVIDESHKHAGHAGAKAHAAEHGSGESHFHVIITSEAFTDMSRIQRHRAVMEALAAEARAWRDAFGEAEKAWLEASGVEDGGDEAKQFAKDYRARHPYPFANVDDDRFACVGELRHRHRLRLAQFSP